MVSPQDTYKAGPNGNEVLGPNPGTNILTTNHICIYEYELGCPPSQYQWQIQVYKDPVLKTEQSWCSLLLGGGTTQKAQYHSFRYLIGYHGISDIRCHYDVFAPDFSFQST